MASTLNSRMQAVDDDLEVELAHAGDDGLAGLLVGATRKVGSSSASRARRGAELVLVGLRLRLDGDVDDGLGEVIDSSTTGASSAHSVSPVVVSLRPTAAAISPAPTSSTSSRWFACICSRRPTRSLPVVALRTWEPDLSLPE